MNTDFIEEQLKDGLERVGEAYSTSTNGRPLKGLVYEINMFGDRMEIELGRLHRHVMHTGLKFLKPDKSDLIAEVLGKAFIG